MNKKPKCNKCRFYKPLKLGVGKCQYSKEKMVSRFYSCNKFEWSSGHTFLNSIYWKGKVSGINDALNILTNLEKELSEYHEYNEASLETIGMIIDFVKKMKVDCEKQYKKQGVK